MVGESDWGPVGGEAGIRFKAFQSAKKTSLLRRLQAQTLPDATPPAGKIHPFSKIAVTFEPIQQV